MLALTVRQPFASLIMLGLKTWETRNWQPAIGEECMSVAIHAAKTITPQEMRAAYDPTVREVLRRHFKSLNEMPLGVVLGVVEVSFSIPIKVIDPRSIAPFDRLVGWWDSEFAWKLAAPTPWSSPVPAQGQQGLWEFNP